MYVNLFSCTSKSSVFRIHSIKEFLLNFASKEIYVRTIMLMLVSLQLYEQRNTEATSEKYIDWCKGRGGKKL